MTPADGQGFSAPDGLIVIVLSRERQGKDGRVGKLCVVRGAECGESKTVFPANTGIQT